jgi:hypothetical protein
MQLNGCSTKNCMWAPRLRGRLTSVAACIIRNCISFAKIRRLMFGKAVAVYCEKHPMHTCVRSVGEVRSFWTPEKPIVTLVVMITGCLTTTGLFWRKSAVYVRSVIPWVLHFAVVAPFVRDFSKEKSLAVWGDMLLSRLHCVGCDTTLPSAASVFPWFDRFT